MKAGKFPACCGTRIFYNFPYDYDEINQSVDPEKLSNTISTKIKKLQNLEFKGFIVAITNQDQTKAANILKKHKFKLTNTLHKKKFNIKSLGTRN